MGLGGRSKLKSCAARRKALKDKGKGQGNSDLGCIPQLGVSHPASVGIVHASEAEESVASFQGPGALSEQQHLELMRQAKLLWTPVVDSDIEHQLVFLLGSSSSSRSCSCSSSDFYVKHQVIPRSTTFFH